MEQSGDRAFADLLEAAPDAMICVDHQGRIAGVPAEAEKLCDDGRTDLAGQPIEILVPEETRRLHAGHRDRYLAQPGPGRWARAWHWPARVSLTVMCTSSRSHLTRQPCSPS